MKKTILMTSILAILSIVLSACNLTPAQPTQISPDAINTIAAQTVQALTTQMAPPPATATPTQIPPTATPTVTPTSSTTGIPTMAIGTLAVGAATLAPLPASSGSTNCNQAYFIEDATIPDGTVVAPGEAIVKKWKLRNDGTCNWTTDYQVVYVSGNENYTSPLTGEVDANIPEVTVPTGITTVGINLVAPKAEGSYTYNFKLQSADGKQFGIGVAGAPFTMVIKVKKGGSSSTSTETVGITGKTISASACSAKSVTLTGTITTDEAITVKYSWMATIDGTDTSIDGPHTLVFNLASPKTFTLNYTFDTKNIYPVWLYINDPGGETNPITVDCTK
jgi:hypothetical protein